MAISLKQKKVFVEKLHRLAREASSLVVADPSYTPAAQLAQLRSDAQEQEVTLCLVKNTLAKKAFANTAYETLAKNFSGPCLCGFSFEHPGAAARLFVEFAKQNPKYQAKQGMFEGKLLGETEINWLAKLPNRKEAFAQLLFTLKEGTIGQLARVLTAYAEHKRNSEVLSSAVES